jgi:hypothetical protein
MMADELKIMLNNESLNTLLRSNLACYLGKTINHEILIDITKQIVESIDYFLNKPEESL